MSKHFEGTNLQIENQTCEWISELESSGAINGLHETMMLNFCQNNTGKILTACCVCIMGSIKFYYAKNNEVLPSSLSPQIAKLSLARNI